MVRVPKHVITILLSQKFQIFFSFLNSLQFEFFERTEYRIFFLASANLSPCHKTLEENPIYLPEPGTLDVRTSRKALGGSQVKLFQNAN